MRAYKELICRSAFWSVENPTFGMPVRRRATRAAQSSGTTTAA